MTTTPARRIAGAAAASATLALTLGGCTARDDSPGGDASTTPSPSSTSLSPTPSAEPTQPTWMDDYTDKQLKAYNEALDAWSTYEQRSEPIWARGKATPAARQLFQKYFPSPLWQDLFQKLEGYEQVDIKISGVPDVLWSRPSRVALEGGTASVQIVQCLDFSPVQLTQAGIAQESYQFPVRRSLVVNRPKGFRWLVYEVDAPAGKNFKRCDPEGGNP